MRWYREYTWTEKGLRGEDACKSKGRGCIGDSFGGGAVYHALLVDKVTRFFDLAQKL
jgi:hypothetical protein